MRGRHCAWPAALAGLMAGAMVLLVQGLAPARHASPLLTNGILTGRTIVIDPGHGGWDPGALGRVTREDTINLEISLDLRRWLMLAGARVVMTWSRPSQIPSDRKYRVRDRVTFINKSGAGVLIDIHCNSGYAARGPQVFFWNGAPSRLLANNVAEELSFLTRTHRPVTRINQYVLRHAKMPAVNVEVGFINNRHEEELLMNARYQQELAWYIFIGIERWYARGRWPASWLKLGPPAEMLYR